MTNNATADGGTADSWLDQLGAETEEADTEAMCFEDTSRLVAEPARASLDILDVDEISMDINALSDVHALDNAPPPAQGPPPARNTSLPDANALDEISMDNAPPPARGPVPTHMHGSGQFE